MTFPGPVSLCLASAYITVEWRYSFTAYLNELLVARRVAIGAKERAYTMNQELLSQAERIYIPAVPIPRATLKYSWNKLPVATTIEPERVCGEARRIGYTGKSDTDLALYRLKIRAGHGLPTMTLPNLYIIENGLFQDYEQWSSKQTMQ